MKHVNEDLKKHVHAGCTTLCTCWLITKTNDAQLGFTDHDQPLRFKNMLFEPTGGMEGTARVQKRETAVDNSEIIGILDDTRITQSDILDGHYFGAQVEVFKVNWRAPDQYQHIRTDSIGEIKQLDGQFKAELRSKHVLLNQTDGRLYQQKCTARFCDKACGLHLLAPQNSQIISFVEKQQDGTLVFDQGTKPDGWARHGRLIWLSGACKNQIERVETHTLRDGQTCLYTAHQTHQSLKKGDQARLVRGCDKTFATCRDVFANQLNFQGFPHIPGDEFVYQYPNSQRSLDGATLFQR